MFLNSIECHYRTLDSLNLYLYSTGPLTLYVMMNTMRLCGCRGTHPLNCSWDEFDFIAKKGIQEHETTNLVADVFFLAALRMHHTSDVPTFK